ncbi:MAG: hypothetical protein M1839_002246 [Geoglossum umbratile]|nr:MAG: hypothetical protein M1839_002246 [Geoglossum umbratile]
MVTGVEAAGLVLATFPLVIEGLKFYLRGLEALMRWRRYVKLVADLIRRTSLEQRKFRNTCTELFSDLVTEEELAFLLDNPGSFGSKDIQASLRERLGESFGEFSATVADTTSRLEDFKKRLDLNDVGRPIWLERGSSFKREWKRVKLSLAEGIMQPLLDGLRKNNDDLLCMLLHCKRMEIPKPPRSGGLISAKYDRIRGHAQNLYGVLNHSLTRPCGCLVAHVASLQLEIRNEGGLGQTQRTRIPKFNVLFSFESDPAIAQPTLWNWCDTVIEPSGGENPENDDAPRQSRFSGQTSAPVPAIAQPATAVKIPPAVVSRGARFSLVAMVRDRRPRNRAKVTFEVPLNNEVQVPRVVPYRLPASERVECLCTAIRSNTDEKPCLGFLAAEPSSSQQHSINLTGATFCPDSTRIVSLATLLSPQLERKHRLSLAVKLSSALLQLHLTPWLDEMWGKQDIFFVKQQDDSGDIILQKPFVSKPFTPPTCRKQQAQGKGPVSCPPRVRNQSTFGLAVLLIELWFGKTLEDLRIPADTNGQNEPNQTTDFATAMRLLDDVYSCAGVAYGDAVRRCLFCEFDQWPPNLETRAMKEAVHRGVVMPLELYLRFFLGEQLDSLF